MIYGSAAALLGALFVGVLRGPVRAALPENDLWWMMPTLSHYTEGQSLGQLLPFLLSPAPLILGQPVLKIYLWLGLVLFGGSTTPLLLISLAVHLANAVLLYAFSRQLALGRRVSLCAALVYLTFFAHFHAYLWPTAFQHLFAVGTILGMVSLYLHADRLDTRHRHARWWFMAMLGVTLFASLQRSTLIAPALILAHILLCSKDTNDRAARYDRWLPLFALYAIYPVTALTFIGDPIISTALSRVPLGPGLTAGALFLIVAVGLWTVRMLVRGYSRYQHRWLLTRAVPLAAALAVFAVLCLRDHRQVLLPYNALLPFVSLLTSFMDPLHKALAIDPIEPYYQFPAQAGVASLLLAAALLVLFAVQAASRYPQRLLLIVWYVMSLLRLNVYSYLILAPSRYFIYLSPVAAILICWALAALVDALSARMRFKLAAGHLLMAGLVVLLCAPNVLAIRLALFRGRLANTYEIYDDVRAIHLIRDDVRSKGATRLQPGAIVVQQVLPLPLQELVASSPIRPDAYDAFRAVMAETFNDPAMRGVQVNVAPAGARAVYVISTARVRTAAGEDMDPFTRLLDRALARLNDHRDAEALELFQRAIATRPFLLRYVLAPCDLDDVRWVTGGPDLRRWVDALGALRAGWISRPVPKYERIAAMMRQELSEYLFCLVCAAYLEHRAGHVERSRYWLAQTRFIDNDPERWLAWISTMPAVSTDGALLTFVRNVEQSDAIGDPKPWRADDYGFERFLLRLFLQWDIRGRQRMLGAEHWQTAHKGLTTQGRDAKPRSLAGGLAG